MPHTFSVLSDNTVELYAEINNFCSQIKIWQHTCAGWYTYTSEQMDEKQHTDLYAPSFFFTI